MFCLRSARSCDKCISFCFENPTTSQKQDKTQRNIGLQRLRFITIHILDPEHITCFGTFRLLYGVYGKKQARTAKQHHTQRIVCTKYLRVRFYIELLADSPRTSALPYLEQRSVFATIYASHVEGNTSITIAQRSVLHCHSKPRLPSLIFLILLHTFPLIFGTGLAPAAIDTLSNHCPTIFDLQTLRIQ